MLSHRYDYGYSGWDEPPFPRPDSVRRNEERFGKARDRARKNSPRYVLFELGLVIAAPLVLAVAVTALLHAMGIATGY